jgi:hypothetical protein
MPLRPARCRLGLFEALAELMRPAAGLPDLLAARREAYAAGRVCR